MNNPSHITNTLKTDLSEELQVVDMARFRSEIGEILLRGKEYDTLVRDLTLPKKKAKPHYTPRVINQLLKLAYNSPNFEEYINQVIAQIQLHDRFNLLQPLRLLPTLLVGPPGEGKTYIAKLIAKITEICYGEISLSNATEAFILSGCPKGYSTAYPGDVVIRLAKSKSINPIILLDEIDKAAFEQRERSSVTGPLLRLLEKDTASNFEDACLKLEVNASHCSWIATANNIDSIPDPILSRFNIVHINPSTKEQKLRQLQPLLESVLDQMELNHRLKVTLADDLIDKYSDLSIRDWKIKLQLAISKRLYKQPNSSQLTLNEMDLQSLIIKPSKPSLGFIPQN